ncbi:MAG: hypothetical protein LC792_21740, partial [Actinobacteria bacterium]|nr:hypothetical protein [Actinomycetota bacterium]
LPYCDELAAAGIVVTSRWLTDPTPELTDDAWRALAVKDLEDIQRAEALVLFAEHAPSGGGRHVEFGIALGLGKRLVVVGGIENLFQRLPRVDLAETWAEAFKLIIG